MPTFSNLSPLRQSISNPNMKEAADLVLTFGAESVSRSSLENGGSGNINLGDLSPSISDLGL